MAADFGKRFDELLQQADQIEARKTQRTTGIMNGWYVDAGDLTNWRVKAHHLLIATCGDASVHVSTFVQREKHTPGTNLTQLHQLRAILLAAKEDYAGGYLNTVRNLVQAELFDDELEQAEELLKAGYHAPAAVIAGVVLETRLRKMCQNNKLSTGKLDKMNADLVKAGAYKAIRQEQITVWAGIRNAAAHGNADQFTRDDVAAMIRDVRTFLAGDLS
jgi:hypothetical protein